MQNKPFADWSLSEWLDFLENRHFEEVQLRLVNANKVAEILNILKWEVPVITISGTNGKGSTVAALNAIYSAAGFRVGCFTSPHLIKFNERIGINKQPISDEDLCAVFTEIESMRSSVPLTYFEVATLAALLYFKKEKPDVIILEVGVGGRLDATNIIDADLSIITTVDIDHQEYLGDDRESIGFEKAGIMRPNQTSIYADELPPNSIKSHSNCINANVLYMGKDYSYESFPNSLMIKFDNAREVLLPRPGININAAVAAIIASDCLSSILPVTSNHWTQAMTSVHLPGRLQLSVKNERILYDVSHNPQAVSLLADYIASSNLGGDIHAIFTGLVDKDLCGIIKPLSGLVKYWYPALVSSKRAASEGMLLEALKKETLQEPVCYANPMDAYNSAAKSVKPGDLIVIYGSFLLVGAIMGNLTYESSCI
jgi:dihydrofolate synthase / folylpolyglutamate synthase